MSNPVRVLSKTILVAAPTARSKAYIQALIANGLHPEKVIMLADDREGNASATSPLEFEKWQGIQLPDLNQPVVDSCQQSGIPCELAPYPNVNDPDTIALIQAQAADTIIYSGSGGQIVSEAALGAAKQYLHMHSGWLPDYRGSTTVYYSLLNGDKPAVTAIFMDKSIDTGPVVAKREYPVPPARIGIDLVYDCAIRADLLVRVMSDFISRGEMVIKEMQRNDRGSVYYVIHPLLKHIAILSLDD